MKNILILIFATTSMISCQNKSSETNLKTETKNMDIELIKKHLKLQEKIELSENDTDTSNLYQLTDLDIDLGGEVSLQGLKNNGYILPKEEDFQKKISELFVNNCDCKYTEENKHKDFTTYFINPNEEKNIVNTEYDYTYDHIFVFSKHRILTTLPLLNDIAEINGNNLKINLEQNTIARNKYLFNNSKGDLTWLLFNDKDFLKALVVYFGYDKEDKINEMVLKDLFQEYSNETPESSYKIGNFIFVKDCSSKLKIRKGVLSYIEKSTSKDNDKYVSALSQYIINVLYANENQTTFTNDEKAEIVASISNIEIPALNKLPRGRASKY